MNTTFVVFVSALLVHSGLCAAIPTKRQTEAEDGTTSISPGEVAAEYMMSYRNTVADETGKPRNLAEAPTSLLCFLDHDIVEEQHRERNPTGGRCTSRSTFVFDLDAIVSQSMTHREDITGRIRAYATVRDHDGPIAVNLTVTMNVYNNYTDFLMQNYTTSNTIATPQVVMVTSDLESGWQFIEITDALQAVWPFTDPVVVEFDIILGFDCSSQRRIPLKFENAAEIPLEQTGRRNRFLRKQPLLIIEVKDRKVLEMLEQEIELVELDEELNSTKSITEGENPEEERRKRMVDQSIACKIENFTADFKTLQIDVILEPQSVNIKRCRGLCTLPVLQRNRNLAPNHAKIMASATAIYGTLNATQAAMDFPTQPQDPCCVPIAYSSIYLILRVNRAAYDLSLFPNFITEKCACR